MDNELHKTILSEAIKSGFDIVRSIEYKEQSDNTSGEVSEDSGSLLLLATRYRPFKKFPPHTGAISSYYIVSHSAYKATKNLAGFLQNLGFYAQPRADINLKQLAVSSGLGYQGKNSLAINDSFGSYIFLSSILTNIPVDRIPNIISYQSPSGSSPGTLYCCLECSNCLRICPSGAITGNENIDVEKCLRNIVSGHLPQDKELAIKLMSLMGNRLLGCDDCQLCCPSNAGINKNRQDIPDHLLELTDLNTLLTLEGSEYSRHIYELAGLIGSNMARPSRIKLNAAIAACNYKGTDLDFKPALMQYLRSKYQENIHPWYREFITRYLCY